MKLIGFLIAAAFVLAAADKPAAVTYVDHDKVAEALAKGSRIAAGSDYSASGARRTGPGQVEVHEKETDIFYVMEGEATFITGGTVVNGKVSRPDQILGTDIQGGETHHLAKGDVIVIPAGTPHWFKQIPKSIKYFTVKSIKP